jgi:L-malate glycosyltransferase
MRIAILTEFCKPYFNGGGELRYHEIARRLVKKGHKVDLICCRFKDSPKKEVIDGINIYHVGPLIKRPPKRSVFDFLYYMWASFFFLLKRRYEIIDSNTYFPLIPTFLIGKLKGIPTIATINILIGDWKEDVYNATIAKYLERFLFKLPFTRVLTVSQYAKKELIKRFRVRPSRISVIYNGVDLDFINSIKVKKQNKKTIVYVGRLVWFKHIEDLVEAVAILKKEIKDIKLKIVGNGTKMGVLKRKVEELDLTKNIKILGKKNCQQTIRHIKESSLLVLPSTKDTFGMVLAEANAAGKPVIAYGAGGALDVIVNKKNGYLVKPRNVVELSQKIKKVLLDPSLCKKMGQEGKKRSEEKFNWDIIAEEIEREYENCKRSK